jgi:hypothetical protein
MCVGWQGQKEDHMFGVLALVLVEVEVALHRGYHLYSWYWE